MTIGRNSAPRWRGFSSISEILDDNEQAGSAVSVQREVTYELE